MSEENLIDHEFGKLQINEQLGWWEGKKEIRPGHEISISFIPEDNDISSFLDSIRPVFRHIAESEKEYRIAAAGELLELYNTSWNDEEPIDVSTFADKMRLEGMVFYESGNSEMFYHDGDLFWGHAICVSVDSQGVVRRANIAG